MRPCGRGSHRLPQKLSAAAGRLPSDNLDEVGGVGDPPDEVVGLGDPPDELAVLRRTLTGDSLGLGFGRGLGKALYEVLRGPS